MVAKPAALCIRNSTAALLSITGLVFAFTAIAVKPLLAATSKPFLSVSLSSKPGSPRETLVSNQPQEICRFSFSTTVAAFWEEMFVSIFVIIPSSIKISFFADERDSKDL